MIAGDGCEGAVVAEVSSFATSSNAPPADVAVELFETTWADSTNAAAAAARADTTRPVLVLVVGSFVIAFVVSITDEGTIVGVTCDAAAAAAANAVVVVVVCLIAAGSLLRRRSVEVSSWVVVERGSFLRELERLSRL